MKYAFSTPFNVGFTVGSIAMAEDRKKQSFIEAAKYIGGYAGDAACAAEFGPSAIICGIVAGDLAGSFAEKIYNNNSTEKQSLTYLDVPKYEKLENMLRLGKFPLKK